MRYNGLMNSKFRGCEVYGHLNDTHRQRVITIYLIPDEPEVFGLCDGVDSWMSSRLSSFKDLMLGPPPINPPTIRKRIITEDAQPIVRKRILP